MNLVALIPMVEERAGSQFPFSRELLFEIV
jgi:hypothetical protein